MDKIKTVKIKNEDGTVSEESYSISVDAINVDMSNGRDLQDTVGNIDVDEDGNIASQLNNLNNNVSDLNNNIKKKVYYFDTVTDMKNANLKNGDTTITLGYYKSNDGGAAEYKIVDSSNSYVENLNNGLKAELIIKDKVNVKKFGAYGDGIHNDQAAIQTAINFGKNRTIYFPDNQIFLIKSHIYTSAQHNEKQFLQLAPNTIIKASLDFSDEYVIRLGEVGTMEGYGSSNYITGLDGGTIDGSSVAAGICSERTHMARITNTNVIYAKNVGIKIARSNNTSSDTWMENVYIHGCDITNTNAIGLWIDGYDNNILMVRTSSFPIGIKLTGGGNFLKNCHPLYGVGSAGLDYYENSVAFWNTSGDNHFEQCYNDNFSTGFLQDGNIRWSCKQIFNYWYENFNYKHYWIRVTNSDYFRGRIDGLLGSFPSSGNNRILIAEDKRLGVYNIGLKPDTHGCLDNLTLNNQNQLLNYWTDEAITNNMLGIQDYTMLNIGENIAPNTWYPFLFVCHDGSVPLTVELSIGNFFKANLDLKTSGERLDRNEVLNCDIITNRYEINSLEIGVQFFTFSEENVSRPLAVWYYKVRDCGTSYPTGGMGGYGISIKGGNIKYSKIAIPPRQLSDFSKLTSIIAPTQENPIQSTIVIDNTSTSIYRGKARGNHIWKTVNTIDFSKYTFSSCFCTIHYGNYDFLYLIKAWGNNFWTKELLNDSNSIGHEPTFSYNTTSKIVTITCPQTSIMDYFII